MELTDKCKEAFEKWNSENNYGKYKFEDFNDSMQYGVYVDFFESVGLFVEVKVKPKINFNYGIHDRLEWLVSSEFFNSRPEARKAAIQKANEIFNQ